jgi:hypothetical protein
MDWMKKLPQWITGGIAVITAITGFVNLLRGNYYIGLTVLCVLVLLGLLLLSFYLYLATEESKIEPGKKRYKFAKYRVLAFLGILAIIACIGFLLGYSPSREFAISALIGTPTLTKTITPYPTYTPCPRYTAIPTYTRYPTYSAIPTFSPVPTAPRTPTLSPSPTPFRLALLNWKFYTDGKGSQVDIRTITAKTHNAIELSYNIIQYGYVGVSNDIDPELLFNGSGIGFFLMGGGTPETVEIKLIYEPEVDGNSAIFSINWPKKSVVDGWEYFEAPFDKFTCWVGTPCPRDGKLDIEDVRIIDFAVSNKSGDVAGPGYVIIDDIHLLE